MYFRILTRFSDDGPPGNTWQLLADAGLIRPQDRGWGPNSVGIPSGQRLLSVSNNGGFAAFEKAWDWPMGAQDRPYTGVTIDGEWKPEQLAVAIEQVEAISAELARQNKEHRGDGTPQATLQAFYPMALIEAEIGEPPFSAGSVSRLIQAVELGRNRKGTVVVGKTYLNCELLPLDPNPNRQRSVVPYLNQIVAQGQYPAVLIASTLRLGPDGEPRAPYDANELKCQITVLVEQMGVSRINFFYPDDEDGAEPYGIYALKGALEMLRR